MFFEQHALEPEYRCGLFLAVARQGRPRSADPRRLEDCMERGYVRASGDGKPSQDPRGISPPTSSLSRTSRSTATPMSPTAATLTWRPSQRSAPGGGGSNRPPVSSPWTGAHRPISKPRRRRWRDRRLGLRAPVHGDETGGLFDPPQPGADRREGRQIIVAAVGDMGVAIERDVGDGELVGREIARVLRWFSITCSAA